MHVNMYIILKFVILYYLTCHQFAVFTYIYSIYKEIKFTQIKNIISILPLPENEKFMKNANQC